MGAQCSDSCLRTERRTALSLPHWHLLAVLGWRNQKRTRLSLFMPLWETYFFGLMLGIAIGPIALLILNTALQAGWRAGLACAAGATSADLLFALPAFTLAGELVPLLNAHQPLLQGLAALVLLLFALHMLWQLRRPPATAAATPRGVGHHYRNTLLLTLVNPLTVLAFASYATQLTVTAPTVAPAWLALVAALGTGTVALALVVGAHAVRRFITNPFWLRLLNGCSAVGILLFAVRGLWQGLQR